MICRKCGEFIEDGASFCTNCGEKIQPSNNGTENFAENVNENNSANNNGCAYENPQGGYYSDAKGGAYPGSAQNPDDAPGYWYPPVNDKAASVKDYLKWMLLYPLWALIPGVGFIIYLLVCFKNAFDGSFKARANFFKAVLITQAISLGIAILFFIIMFTVFGSLVATGMSSFEEMYPELFEEFEAGYNTLRIMFGR